MLMRLLTGIVLAPLALFTVYYSSYPVFAGLLGAIYLASFYEGLALVPLKANWQKLSALLLMAILGGLCTAFISTFLPLLPAWLGIWLLLCLCIVSYPKGESFWGHPILVGAVFALVLLGSYVSLLALKQSPLGSHYVIYLMFLVWAADTGAYFAGKTFGKHKLIVRVSPGKTIEGLFGAFVLSLVIAAIANCHFHQVRFWSWYGLVLLVTLLSVFGDLYISMLKRRVSLKDTGHILPGHGGLLDRLDSLLSASVLFVVVGHCLQLI